MNSARPILWTFLWLLLWAIMRGGYPRSPAMMYAGQGQPCYFHGWPCTGHARVSRIEADDKKMTMKSSPLSFPYLIPMPDRRKHSTEFRLGSVSCEDGELP
jgi:hypothetical protein